MLTDSLKNYPGRNPPVCCQTVEAWRHLVISLLPVLEHVLIVQVPVLPQLQGPEQNHESAKT
jgi:hypothetical protein